MNKLHLENDEQSEPKPTVFTMLDMLVEIETRLKLELETTEEGKQDTQK